MCLWCIFNILVLNVFLFLDFFLLLCVWKGDYLVFAYFFVLFVHFVCCQKIWNCVHYASALKKKKKKRKKFKWTLFFSLKRHNKRICTPFFMSSLSVGCQPLACFHCGLGFFWRGGGLWFLSLFFNLLDMESSLERNWGNQNPRRLWGWLLYLTLHTISSKILPIDTGSRVGHFYVSHTVGAAGIACWWECQACDQKVVSSNSGRGGGRVFFSRVKFVRWLLFSFCSTPRLSQWHVKDPGHSAKSAGGRLHLSTRTFLTQ